MKVRFAFAGFRHGHIFSLLKHANAHPDVEVVALCEEDEATREALKAAGTLDVTHTCHAKMLAEVPCDVVAVGDVYGRRGQIIIEALKAGKHVISDKPVCTRLEELDEIEALLKEKGLQLGCQLDLRNTGRLLTLRKVLDEGTIGEVVTINITAQHPLNLGVRPSWYFEPDAHGGTINDIGIHAFDILPWLTGHKVTEVLASRAWNAKATEYPHFGDCAQVMARLANGAGVLADFSYLAPCHVNFSDECYWRIICHGTKGVASTSLAVDGIRVVADGATAPEIVPLLAEDGGKYLADFLLCLEGRSQEADLTTEAVLTATRDALTAQARASA